MATQNNNKGVMVNGEFVSSEELQYVREQNKKHLLDPLPPKADGTEYTDAEIRTHEENRREQWLWECREQQAQ